VIEVEDREFVKLSVKVPRWIAEWLRRKAEEEGESVSTIARRVLRKGIRQESKGEGI
jgi:hypothetical protein